MKKITLLLFSLSYFISTPVFSQICSPVGSGNTTTLDWENMSTFTFYLSSNGGAASSTVNPFFASGTSCNDNIVSFCNPPSPNNDISSADGWRYVTHDFGQSSNPIECPVFILYNIYSGVLRAFFYKSLTTSGNSAVVSLDYREDFKRTALLEYYGGSVKNAVQVFNNTYKDIKIPNTYVLSPSWSHADFITQYDPCTCQSTSGYMFKLVSTQNSNISFTVNGQVKQDVKANQANGGSQAFTVKTATDGLSIISSLFGIGNGSAPNAYSNIFNAASLYYNQLGVVVKAVDFFAGLLNEQPSALKVTPLIFNVNLNGSGTILTNNPLQNAPLNTPGSNLSNVSVPNRPAYNNVLGTFSLLTTPQIRFRTYVEEDCNTESDPDYGSYTNCYTQNWAQVECVEDIKWVLNPQSELSVSQLVAAYVINTNTGTIQSEPFPLGCFNSYKPVYYLGGGTSNSIFPSGNFTPNIQSVFLKITGVFDASNSQKLAFTSLYKVNLQNIYGNEYLEEQLPGGCSTITPPASASEIQAVCNSYQYTSRRDQFFVAPNDNGVGVKGKNGLKNSSELQISPNPANSSVEIQYNLKADSRVQIGIYDLAGKMIKSLANDKGVKQGQYILQVDLSDIASGMYIVQLNVNGKTEIKKLSVMKK